MKLISTIEEVQTHLPVTMTSEITAVEPFISNAERSYLIKLIGKDQFTALVNAYESANKHIEEIENEEVKEAVRISQQIITTIGYFKYVPFLSAKISDSGIQVYSNTDTKQAFAWQVEDIKSALLDLGYSAIEELLLHLESNPDIFQPFIDSDEFISSEQFLIENAKQFSDCFNIGNSRYVFQNISYIMARIESQQLEKMFGPSFFNSLKDDSLTGKPKELAEKYLKPGIALLTAAKALVERIITLEGGVARINLITSYEAAKNTMAATRDQVKDSSEQLIADGNQFLQDGLQFIADNAADFPTYIAPESRKRYNIINDPEGGIFAL